MANVRRGMAVAVAAMTLAAPAKAAGPWQGPARLGAGDFWGVAAGIEASGDALLAAGRAGGASVFSFPSGAGAASPLTGAPAGTLPVLSVNRSGEAVLAVLGPRPEPLRVALRAPDGSLGAPVELANPDGQVQAVSAHIADDGTAIVAWRSFGEAAETDHVRAAVRPPGGAFGAPLEVMASTEPAQFGAAPRAFALSGGGAEVLFTRMNRIISAAYAPASGVFTRDTVLVTPRRNRVRDFAAAVAPSGGRAVVVYDGPTATDRRPWINALWAVRRASRQGAWTPPEELAHSGPEEYLPEVALTPDGGALVAYLKSFTEFGELSLRTKRAVGAGAFGSAQNVLPREAYAGLRMRGGRRYRLREVTGLDLAVNARGEAALAFLAVCRACDRQLKVAAAPAGGRFRAPEDISAAGLLVEDFAVTLSDAGEALVFWQDAVEVFAVARTLRLAWARALPAAPATRRDRRPPRVALALPGGRSALARAVRTGRLDVRVACSEQCGVNVNLPGVIWRIHGDDAPRASRRIVLARRGAGIARLRFHRPARRAVARLLGQGRVVRVRGLGFDRAGNLRVHEIGVRTR